MRQRKGFWLLLAACFLLLAACQKDSAQGNGIKYEAGGNGPDSVVIQGYDAAYLEYNGGEEDYLYFASPKFLGGAFGDKATEGEAMLNGQQITVRFTRDDDQEGTVFGASAQFTVDLQKGAVTEETFTPWEGQEISMTQEEMTAAGRQLAEIIQGAQAHLQGE